MANNEDRNARPLVDARGCVVFNWQLSPADRRDPVVCRLPPEFITYDIYASGKIIVRKPPSFDEDADTSLVRYVYYDADNMRHDLGQYDYTRIRKRAAGGGLGEGYTRLVNLDKLKNYNSGNVKFGFENDSKRPYISDVALASLLGAMLEVGYEDISCNGFSRADGTSTPSTSHINGINGDFKYLRLDGSTQTQRSLYINVSPELMDEKRQIAFNEALFKFGWKRMLSWRYMKDGAEKLLPHATHLTNHHHHLHVQGYAPTLE